MSGYRTRGLLRAAALLAIGASPLLASAASAAEGPAEIVDGPIGKIGDAPEVGLDATKPVTDLLSKQAVKLPAPLPGGTSDVTVPKVAAPAALKVPAAPQLPLVGDVLAPQTRALPDVSELPVKPPISGPSQMPDLTGELGKLSLPLG